MPSEIAGLEPLHGYIKQGNLVVPAYLPYLKPKSKQRGFIERTIPVAAPRIVSQSVPLAISAAPAVDQLDLPKKPVKNQPAFAPFSKQRAVNEKSSEWDESEWIE
jgi:hypothetical protein